MSSYFLIDSVYLEVVCRTETAEDAHLIADVTCSGDFYIADLTSKLKAFTVRQLQQLTKSLGSRAKDQPSHSFALSELHASLGKAEVKTPADYDIKPGVKPSTPTLTEETDMATKKKAPPKRKAAAKKAPAQKKATAKKGGPAKVWDRPQRGKTLELWQLFDKLVKAKSATRKGMLDAAVEKGYNEATATTQYGRWLTEHLSNGGTAPERSTRQKKAA